MNAAIDSLQFQYEIQTELTYDTEFDVNSLFSNDDARFTASSQNGILICGFLIDGAEWDYEHKCLIDSEKRFTPAPHILTNIYKVIVEYNFI